MNPYNFLKFLENTVNKKTPFQIKWTKFRDTITKEDLNVEGSVDFTLNRELKTLPDNLTVSKDLRLSYTNIPELPRNLKVGENLWLSFSKITKIPEDLQVGGILDLSNTSYIRHLPSNFKVDNLYLSGSSIGHLPENLTATYLLDIRNTSISEIPKNLKTYSFYTTGSELDKMYSEAEIRKMIKERGGSVERIYGSAKAAS